MRISLIVALALFATIAAAQQNTLELLRQDLKAQKVAIMAASLPLTKEQAELFWPLYREYNYELGKLGDRRVAVIKKFAERYDDMDAETADLLVRESIDISSERTKLLGTYYKKAAEAVGITTAARFLQLENQMLTLLDAQIVAQIPLVKFGPAAEEKPK